MALSRAHQDWIIRRDTLAREAREQAEIEEIASRYPRSRAIKPGTMLVRADAKAIGAVTAITHRASQSSWARLERHTLRGVAPGTEDTSDGTPTVRVTKNGKTEIRTVASFRQTREITRRRATPTAAQGTPETANAEKYGTHILTGE